ncbi:MAG: hypothetical protein HY921_05800 [Elusimicrobia bacterium]|nr:hypothetical protein [Elusimicrobiota bacterium]
MRASFCFLTLVFPAAAWAAPQLIEIPGRVSVILQALDDSGDMVCQVRYPKSEPRLKTVAETAALACRERLPQIEGELFGKESARPGEMRLGRPAVIDFLPPRVLRKILTTRPQYKDEYALHPGKLEKRLDTNCQAAVWFGGNLVACRADRWVGGEDAVKIRSYVVHELTHVVLWYGHERVDWPKWLDEAVADHLAYSRGLAYPGGEYGCDGAMTHYSEGYNCGAALLGYAVWKYGLDLKRLARDMRLGKAKEGPEGREDLPVSKLFVEYTGKSLEHLWRECLGVPTTKKNGRFRPGCEGGSLNPSPEN